MIIIFTLFQVGAFAKSEYISECQSKHKTQESAEQFKWLSLYLNTNNCFLQHTKLSNFKSLSEIILPFETINQNYRSSWLENFPYINGLSSTNEAFLSKYYYLDMFLAFKNVHIFKEFKNIIHIPFKKNYRYVEDSNICEILRLFPQIKQISTESSVLENEEADNCINSANIEVIISGNFLGFKRIPVAKIIGFEEYQGTFGDLIYFPYARYIGISEVLESQGNINTLSKKINITHLSLNIIGITNIESLSNLINLTNLTLFCTSFKAEEDNIESGCFKKQLTDISFLRKLYWLKQINLSSNAIEDLRPIENLIHLEKIELKYNIIKKIPKLSNLKKLKYLDLSYNLLESLKRIESLKELTYLDVSGNNIDVFPEILMLQNLIFLNISNNKFQGKMDNFQVPDALKVLDISGFRAYLQEDPYLNYNSLDFLKKGSAFSPDYYKMISLKSSLNGSTTPFISDGINFKKFKNLESIIMSNNDLRIFPNISSATKLKYIDLERNQIENFPTNIRHNGIKAIDLSVNNFQKLPNFSIFPNLTRIDLIKNSIKDFDNLITIKNNRFTLTVRDNQIEDLSPISISDFKRFEFELDGNPIKKDLPSCPFVKNSSITTFCNKYLEPK